MGNIQNPYGNNDKEQPSIPFLNKSQSVSPNPIETSPVEPPKRRDTVVPKRRGTLGGAESSVLDSRRSSGTLSPERMKEVVGRIQSKEGISTAISPATELHERLQKWGAYEKLDTRRSVMLQTYLTKETPIPELGNLPEVQIRSGRLLSELLHSAMRDAFNELPEKDRADYDNDPEVALQTRSRQQTQQKSERIKEAQDKYRNPETGKVEISDTQKQNVAEANRRRGEQIREGTYKGRPVGRPPKNAETGKIELSDTQKAEFLRWLQEKDALRALRAEDQPSDQAQADPEGGNTPT